MPATPIRRRRVPAAVAAGVICIALLGGCTQTQRDAKDYKGTEKHFLQGCKETAAEDNAASGTETKIASPASWCQCVFDAISDEQTGIDFDRFKEVNTDLRENGGKLPSDIQKAYDSCDPADS